MTDMSFENGILTVGSEKHFALKVDVSEVLSMLNAKEREAIARCVCKHASFDHEISQAVMRRLANDADDAAWSSDDEEFRFTFLSLVEDALVSGYKWTWLNWLYTKIRDIGHEDTLYWKLYHDDELGLTFRAWCNKNNVVSDYTIKLTKWSAALTNFVEKAFEGLKEGKLVPESSEETT